jgi:hypothetical protein
MIEQLVPDLSTTGNKHYTRKNAQVATNLQQTIDILYTLDSASNYSAMQKLKP